MMKFASAAIAAGVLAMGVQASAAADLRAAPAYKAAPVAAMAAQTWSGLYIGINGGAAFSESRTSGLVGGTLGYNFQSGPWVLGVEGDMDWSDLKGNHACVTAGFNCTTENSYLGTVRGRFGFTTGPALLYVTGGAAFGDLKQSATSATMSFSETANRVGWTIGGGAEYAFAPNWSAKAEYLYVNFDDFNCGAACSGAVGSTATAKLDANIVRVGVNYKFGDPIFGR